LNFRDRPDAFASDEAKVAFALSYLKGTALDYFEPTLMDPDENPIWSTDYSEFTSELWTNFGPFNPEADAKNELDRLRMKDNQKIAKYIVSFQQLAPRV
jgi:Retrotransposon gag protein